jgi:hypothetical protein
MPVRKVPATLGFAERRYAATLEQEEDAMKLNTAQVKRTVSQLQIEALPEDHPLVPQLNRIFGDHTYFLDGSGLNILEPAAAALEVPPSSIGEVGVLVNVANWTDSNPPKLEVHEPELTNTTVALGTDGGGS